VTIGGLFFGLLVAAAVFVPLEKAFALRRGQKALREGWATDVAHFLFTAPLAKVCGLLALAPLLLLARPLTSHELQAAVASQPRALQFAEALLIANLGAYFGHRLAHSVPLLWRFHSIHHSSERMDWLAAARLHPLDQLAGKALAFVPLYLLGFDKETFGGYVAVATVHAVFIHSNVRVNFGPLRWLVTTPDYHHWHHSSRPEADGKNFAGELPLLDLIFGTLHMPARGTPAAYGTREAVPAGYLAQLRHPFRRRRVAGAHRRAPSGEKPAGGAAV
jgi:sterol desaturase/sphingolipid hydroxylase (fatty acid hydroxylase superfamily)